MKILNKLVRAVQAGYDEYGRELPDPTPVATLAPFRPQLSLEERIKLCMRSVYMEQQQKGSEHDSPEEADDFDVDDDDPVSPYEVPELQMHSEADAPKLDPEPDAPPPDQIPQGSGAGTPQEDPGGAASA